MSAAAWAGHPAVERPAAPSPSQGSMCYKLALAQRLPCSLAPWAPCFLPATPPHSWAQLQAKPDNCPHSSQVPQVPQAAVPEAAQLPLPARQRQAAALASPGGNPSGASLVSAS